MRFSFGRFELDERARALRLDGVERPLQPLVFDLLVYLVHHRERVVPKDELLTKLWDGATVTDGSLQRAVSLLRGVLRDGGMEQAVQTFARRGYRFCETLQTEPAAASTASPPLDAASDATELASSGQWERALEAFDALPDPSTLPADAWLAWGNAALCAGKPEQSISPLERALAAFERAEKPQRAAHVALLLTNVKLEARELAVAKGFHQRALSYLRGQPECKEHALAEWLASRMALFESRLDECRARARVAMEIADRVGDPDLHCLGLIYQGHIFIAQSEVRRGLTLHDEAGAAALAGQVTPWVGGIVFCSVIWAYLHLGDHHRAGQWTDQFTRWCERNASYCYPGLCRLHRGEILAIRGELAHAEAEVRKAREQLASAGPFVEGDACRVLGEIQLARGDLDGAEAAFREAHRLGWNPQPGLSLVLAARGEGTAAIKQLERALAQPTWTDGQRRGAMLAVLARVAAMNGDLERASSALRELRAAPELSASDASAAELARAEGELAWASGDLGKAELALRASIAHWLAVSAPLHAAEVRLRLSELLLGAFDAVSAELELGAAEAAFEQVNATALIARCQALRAKLEEQSSS
ncbi:MAG TPA: winged helix-turn-helix domain-containing protein [Polyangiaceae bacterium]|nr:winged helix-turn-helix domain-containing protein [Polyangiaceae bacterium]